MADKSDQTIVVYNKAVVLDAGWTLRARGEPCCLLGPTPHHSTKPDAILPPPLLLHIQPGNSHI